MIKIEKTEVFGWESAVRGMRNPLNSWEKSDSMFSMGDTFVGENDLSLMKKLSKAGSDHAKFLRMINVTCDIPAPLYWWKEFDTYKVGTVANSCSTMHKIHDKEFTLDDFSHEHLTSNFKTDLHCTILSLNYARMKFLETKDKTYWWQMIQLLPTSYNQLRTVTLNYEVLANMYAARKSHRLDEWRELCEWVKTLPYPQLITGEE
jgi:hypothetical protein